MSDHKIPVGTVITNKKLGYLYGEVIDNEGYHYVVKVDPECEHFRETILISKDEAITVVMAKYDEARQSVRYAERRVDSANDQLRWARERQEEALKELEECKEYLATVEPEAALEALAGL